MEGKRQLSRKRINQGEFAHLVFSITPEEGTTREEIERPEYFAHVAYKFKRYMTYIHVVPDDGTFYALYLVTACDRTWAKVKCLNYVELAGDVDMSAVSDDYDVKLRGPKKWSVVRKSDNTVLSENHFHKADAVNWLDSFLKSAAAA